MKIIKGDCGGIVFRWSHPKGYYFRVCQYGTYRLFLFIDSSGGNAKQLVSNFSSAIHTGLDQANLIAVVANGSTLDLYVNHQKITSVQDVTYSHGDIGLSAEDIMNPTGVIYSNAKVWL